MDAPVVEVIVGHREDARSLVDAYEARYGPAVERVSLGNGVWVVSPFTVTLDDPARAYVAEATYAVDGAGAATLVSARHIARPGTAIDWVADLRLPVRDLAERGLRRVRHPGPVEPPGTRLPLTLDASGVAWYDDWQQPVRRRRVLSAALLADVAAVVREAEAAGLPVRQAVAERYRLPLLTARNWVQRARAEGYLAETAP